jgi:hypothetical protein
MATKEQRRLSGKIAGRNNGNRPASRDLDDPDVQAVREMREANLADHIRKVVEGWPPLTAEQRDRLRALLQPTADHG